MGIGRLRHLVPVVVALVVALAGGRAYAAETTIGFEDQADGTPIGAQYSGLGVQLQTTAGAASLTVASGTDLVPAPRTGTKMLRATDTVCGPGTNVAFSGLFSTPRRTMGLWVHDPYPADPMSRDVTLTTFDAANAQTGQTIVSITSALGWQQLLLPVGSASTIDHFTVTAGSGICQMLFDDLSFDAPAGAEPPSVAWEDVATAPVAVERGAPTTTTATLRRHGGSTGRVNLSVSGLPTGVSATLSPAQANGVDLRSGVTITLSGSPTAPPVTTPVQATLTAAPVDSTAGSAPFSATFPVVVVPPSVTLAVSGAAPTDLYRGDHVTIPARLVRHSLSSGRITLAVAGPSGSTVTVSPAAIDGAAPSTPFDIVVSVAPGAPRDPNGVIRVVATSGDAAAAPPGSSTELALRAPIRVPSFVFGPTLPDHLVLRAGAGTSRVDTLISTEDVPPNAVITAGAHGIPTDVTVDQSPTSWLASDGPTLFKVNLTARVGLSAASSGFRSIDAHVAIPGHAAIDATNFFQLTVVPSIRYALAARGIEVTQGVQTLGTSDCSTIPTRDFSHIESSVPYTGVHLVDGDLTVARVYVSAFVLTNVAGLPNVGVRLHAYRDGREVPGSPLSPTAAPATVKPGDVGCVRPADRASADNVYTYVLPPAFTYGTVTLQAEILPIPPSVTGPVLDECNLHFCQVMKRFTLRSIGFDRIRWPGIKPIRITAKGAGPGSADAALSPARQLHPGDPYIWGYQGDVDISDLIDLADYVATNPLFSGISRRDIVEGGAGQRVSAWSLILGGRTITVGIAPPVNGLNGVSIGSRTIADLPVHGVLDRRPVMVVTTSRPLTSIAHELGHVLGRPHAGQNCNLTRVGDAQEGEQWLPDDQGFLQGVGLDLWGIANAPAAFTPSAAAPYRVIARAQPNSATEIYDLMSYCASTNENPAFVPLPDSWLSPRGWDAEVASLTAWTRKTGGATGAAPRRVVAAGVPVLTVGAIGRGPAAMILSVEPGTGTPAPAAPEGPVLVGYDAAGHELARAGLDDEVSEESGLHSYTGSIASTGIARLAILDQAGAPLADRTRSAHAPRVTITAPRKGATVGGTKPVRLAWKGEDADGDRLLATVEASADDGRTWRRIYEGSASSAVLPAGYFAASATARLRISVNDGFRSASVVSARFRSLRAPASVHIDSPRTGARFDSDGSVSLSGSASTLQGAVASGRLVWSLDGHPIARGARVAVRNLPPGRRRLSLGVRGDPRARATVAVVIRAATPPFLRVSLPSRIARTARFVTVRLRSGAAATIRANGSTVRIRARRRAVLRVPIRPGRGEVVLPLTAHALGADYGFTRAVARR